MENDNLPNDIETKITPFDGKAGIIIGDHAYAGSLAICLGARKTLLGWAYVMAQDETGEEFYVFSPNQVVWQYIF